MKLNFTLKFRVKNYINIFIQEGNLFQSNGSHSDFSFASRCLYKPCRLQCLYCRGLVIGALSPVLQHTGYGFSWQEGTVMCWGGLRGAVGLALALQVAHHDSIDQQKVGLRVSHCVINGLLSKVLY